MRSGELPAVFARFVPWSGEVPEGWTINWLGVRTRVEIQSAEDAANRPIFLQTEAPSPSEDFLEWLDILETVGTTAEPYTIVELGAGWGRWLVNAAAAVRQLVPGRPFLLVGVEAEPTHFEWLQRHLRDNGIDPEEHILVNAAVAARAGRVRFQQGDPAAWYGQAIERDDPAAKSSGVVSRLIRWSVNSAANLRARVRGDRAVRRVRAVSLSSVLARLDLVDLIDADVQGAEAEVFEAAADALQRQVRRVHIGTHGPEIEERLRRLFGELDWECRFDYPGGGEAQTEWGPVLFEDGAQSWVNPALPVPR